MCTENPSDKTIHLSYLFCFFLDDAKDFTSNCFANDEYRCIECPLNSSFHTNGTVKETTSTGHKVSYFLWMLIIVFGLLGTLANTLIILILKKQHSSKSFELLLCTLACFDLVCSIMTTLSSTGIIAFLGNWSRSGHTLTWICVTYLALVLGRTGSTFTKVLIAVERYVFISHPNESSSWLTKTKTRLLSLAILGFSVALHIPGFISIKVIPISNNQSFSDIPRRLADLNISYVMQDTAGNCAWLHNLSEVALQIDLWVPFPLLILFTVLIYREINKITSKKRELQVARKKDIREVQMFIPVIIVLFICNIVPVVHFMVTKYMKQLYREEVLATLLFVALNSAVNLPIYICRGCTFRKEARTFLYKVTNRIG